ncbi:MAG: ASKHA domain-containing protein, partial [Actinomycetota bacterium]|nr:ASKHA domain-containing protein [Actinomycetota bacterium]
MTGFQAGDTTQRQYAAAVDIGTTTVEVAIIDLVSRETIAQATEYNAQVDRGEDIIARIIASTRMNGVEEMQSLVVRTVSHLVTKLLDETGISVDDLVVYLAAGNTVMTHLLLGVSPANIRMAPYVPAAAAFPWTEAATIGLPASPATRLITIASPASWLGGDIVSGVVAAGLPWTEKLTLFVDIGTNGEIVLGNKEFLVACSCSAGPAFEGGGIGHGMRAAEGAIEQVRIEPDTLETTLLTIGSVKPLGICGSGLIDTVSELFLAGAIDRNGKFADNPGSSRIRRSERGAEYVLVPAKDSATGNDIVLAETDIEN